jgi:hypothetical protein
MDVLEQYIRMWSGLEDVGVLECWSVGGSDECHVIGNCQLAILDFGFWIIAWSGSEMFDVRRSSNKSCESCRKKSE